MRVVFFPLIGFSLAESRCFLNVDQVAMMLSGMGSGSADVFRMVRMLILLFFYINLSVN